VDFKQDMKQSQQPNNSLRFEWLTLIIVVLLLAFGWGVVIRFGRSEPVTDTLMLTVVSLMASASLICLGLAVLIINRAIVRRNHEAELERLNATLEQRVVRRTAEITRANQELLIEVSRRKEAEKAMEQRALALTGLYQTSLAINAELNLATLLPAIVERAAELLGAHMGGLYLMEQDQSSLLLVVAHNLKGAREGISLRLGEGLSGRVAESGQPIMVADYQSWEGRAPIFENSSFRRVLAIPLKIGSRVLGVLNITDDKQNGLYSEEEVRLATLFADQAALAIEKAQLYQTAQRELHERRRAELELRSSSERFKHISQSISDFAYSCLKSPSGVYVIDWLSGAVEAITGYTIEEVTAKMSWAFLVIEEDQPIYDSKVTGLEPGQSSVCELRIRRKDGSLRWLMAFSECVTDSEHAQQNRLYGGCRDISERKLMEQDLRNRQNFLEHLNEITRVALQPADFDSMLQLLADRLGEMMEADECCINLWVTENQQVVPAAATGPRRENYKQQELQADEKSLTASVLDHRRALTLEELFNPPQMSPVIAAKFPTRSMLGLPLIANDALLGAALVSNKNYHRFTPQEISMGAQAAGQIALALYNARLLDELQRLAIVDELTGVYNYRGLLDLGRREVERAQRFGRPLSAFFFDIDDFRAFNNRFSHAVGNLVLRAVAQQALASVRSVDFVARFGGEEFVVLIPETELDVAVRIADRLRQAIASHQVETEYGALSVTVSVGVTALTPEVPDLDTLIDQANQAEHQAKEQGKNRVVGYSWYAHH
jgi:diguanylate cyclase (GGDEF)-like protein/PAS domain S-box-containing protein